jgi:hypothetical protein
MLNPTPLHRLLINVHLESSSNGFILSSWIKLKEVVKHEPVPGRHYALLEGCYVDGNIVDQCWIVAGVPTDSDGVKHWDPTLYGLDRGSSGTLRNESDKKNSAIKTGMWRNEYDLSVSSRKWKPFASNVQLEEFFMGLSPHPLPVFNLTFLGYVRPDVDIEKLGKLIYWCVKLKYPVDSSFLVIKQGERFLTKTRIFANMRVHQDYG